MGKGLDLRMIMSTNLLLILLVSSVSGHDYDISIYHPFSPIPTLLISSIPDVLPIPACSASGIERLVVRPITPLVGLNKSSSHHQHHW